MSKNKSSAFITFCIIFFLVIAIWVICLRKEIADNFSENCQDSEEQGKNKEQQSKTI